MIHPGDNVATALRDLDQGQAAKVAGVEGAAGSLLLKQPVRLGHKAALTGIEQGQLVIKHGQPIGRATANIAVGEHVHVHNVVSLSVED